MRSCIDMLEAAAGRRVRLQCVVDVTPRSTAIETFCAIRFATHSMSPHMKRHIGALARSDHNVARRYRQRGQRSDVRGLTSRASECGGTRHATHARWMRARRCV